MGVLKAVPDEPVDLGEFDAGPGGPPPERRWRQVLEALAPGDEQKLRAALLEPAITINSISTWLSKRGLVVDPRTINGWRRRDYAHIA